MSKQDGGSPAEEKKTKGKAKVFKATAERIRESINLINQLVDYGIPAGHYHLAELRELFNNWIRDPEYSFTGKIAFEAFDKKVDLVLPRLPGAQATLHLRKV
jgi:hypothetical protein